MNKSHVIIFLLFISHDLFSQKPASSATHKVTFKLQILSEIVNPDSVAIRWVLVPSNENQPYEIHISFFPKGVNNIYELAMEFQDLVMGRTFAYSYRYGKGKRDFKRAFVLERDKVQDRNETWNYLDGTKGKSAILKWHLSHSSKESL